MIPPKRKKEFQSFSVGDLVSGLPVHEVTGRPCVGVVVDKQLREAAVFVRSDDINTTVMHYLVDFGDGLKWHPGFWLNKIAGIKA